MGRDSENLIGETLGSCRLERLLGQGGMSVVYLAQQIRPERQVAVKVLRAPAYNHENADSFLVRFRREANMVAKLEHVNIIPIYEYGEVENDLAYFVLPYIAGGNLEELLIKRGPLPLDQIDSYLQQAAAALDYAHARGLVHRDLKPGNFLLHTDGRLVLADFGIARIFRREDGEEHLTAKGAIMGTPAYMAPEILRGQKVDYRADIYALGIVIYQLLTGELPFTGGSMYAVMNKHLNEPLPSVTQHKFHIPEAVDDVLKCATSKRTEERFSSAGAMAKAFHEAIILPQSPTELVAPPTLTNEDLWNKMPIAVAPSSRSMSQAMEAPVKQQSYATSPSYVVPSDHLQKPPAPTVKRNRFGGILLFLCLIVVLGGGGWLAWSVFMPTPTPTPPVVKTPDIQAREVISEFYQDINDKKYDAAWNLVGFPMRNNFTATSFREGYESTKKIDLSFGGIEVQPGGDVIVETILLTHESNANGNLIQKKFSWQATVRLVSPDNVWKIVSAIQTELPL